jgi:hypothetical protein
MYFRETGELNRNATGRLDDMARLQRIADGAPTAGIRFGALRGIRKIQNESEKMKRFRNEIREAKQSGDTDRYLNISEHMEKNHPD